MMLMEAPPSSTRLVDAIHERLLKLIGSGALAPESRLHQGSLAEKFGVSRTPVREALLRLEQEGLVYTVPRRGMFVLSVARDDIVQLYEVREVLEPWAVRLACLRATDEDRSAVERIQKRHEQRCPSFQSNREFHIRLVQACGNGVALRVLRSLWAQDSTERIYSLYREQPSSWEHMVSEHRAIVDAFLRGDADRTYELVKHHIAVAGEVTVGGLDPAHSQNDCQGAPIPRPPRTTKPKATPNSKGETK